MRCVKSLLALTLAVCPVSHVLALPSDSSQPIRIQANSATLDDKRNTAVYTGDVVITQGTLRLLHLRLHVLQLELKLLPRLSSRRRRVLAGAAVGHVA